VVRQERDLKRTGSAIESCRRVTAATARCATHTTYVHSSGGDPAAGVLVDKVMTRGIVTVTLRDGRLSVHYRAR
jgi:hypothetical protein